MSTKVIQLDQLRQYTTAVDVVCVVTGIDDMRQVKVGNDVSMVTSLSLSDGTLEGVEVSLSLWGTDCIRSSTLKMLDIVHVRDMIVKSIMDDNETIRTGLHGGHAGVRLMCDSVIGVDGDEDEIGESAVKVKRWRDTHFQVLNTMRNKGRVWNFDDRVHHGQRLMEKGKQRNENNNNDHSDNNINTFKGVLQAGNEGEHAWREIRNVRIEKIMIQKNKLAVLNKREMLKGSCWYGCATCKTQTQAQAQGEHDNRRCEKCSGELRWRYGEMKMQMRDESGGQVTATMTDDDGNIERLLLGLKAHDLMTARSGNEGQEWAISVLMSILNESHTFTAVMNESQEVHSIVMG